MKIPTQKGEHSCKMYRVVLSNEEAIEGLKQKGLKLYKIKKHIQLFCSHFFLRMRVEQGFKDKNYYYKVGRKYSDFLKHDCVFNHGF